MQASHSTPVSAGRSPAIAPTEPAERLLVGPTTMGTVVLLLALALAWGSLGGKFTSSASVAQQIALIVGIGIVGSLLCDLRLSCHNVIRTDVVCIVVLYALILLEMLHPRAEFDTRVGPQGANAALQMILLGFAGLAVGRHLSLSALIGITPNLGPKGKDIPCRHLVTLVYGATFLASLHIFLATQFNPVQIYEGIVGPRFSVPWGRERFGGWKELLNEIGLLYYIVPPLAAILTLRRRELSQLTLGLVWACCAFTFFKAFGSGTRNIFLTHVLSFSGAHLLFTPALRVRRLVTVGIVASSIALSASYFMLEFRNVGLRNYIKKELYAGEDRRNTLSIDNNLESLSKVVSVFPDHYPYLGWEVPIWAVVKPIPRALWSQKPKGLSISIEEALGGDDAYTIATTYIGEAYMAFGGTGVLALSFLFGMLATTWNQLAGNNATGIGTAIYASGFFAAAITMRSFLWLTTAALPTIALFVIWKYYLAQRFHSRLRTFPAETSLTRS